MKHKAAFTVIVIALCFAVGGATLGRGFGGGGFHGGGGGFGGGGFHGGGGFGGGGFGGGGFGGGGGGFHEGGFGGDFGGDRGGFGGDGIRGSGGMAGDGFRGAGGFDRDGFGNLGGLSGGLRAGEFGSSAGRGFDPMNGMRSGSLPSASRLNSFLGLPTDMGMHQAASTDHAFGYTGSSRGVTAAGGERDASGHEWTGPNGTTVAHGSVGERGAAAGPNGAAAGERGARGTVVEGPNGTTVAHGSAGERGGAVGPNGAAAGERGASGTVAKGPNGNTVAHGEAGERGGVVGPNGAAGGARAVSGTAVRGANGNVVAHSSAVTHNWSAADMRVQGNYARNNFDHYDAFNRNWYDHHPNAWWNGYTAGLWSAAGWAAVNTWFGDDWPINGYMYGNDITYVDNNVCLYGQPIATADEYYQSANNLVQTGTQAQVTNPQPTAANSQTASKDPKWLPLGVYEAIPPGDKSSKMLMQLAVNKDGIIRGNYFNTGDNNTQLIEGSIDKKTARAAWVVADKRNMVFDTGLYNLTQSESPVLVHIGKDKNEQWTLVRMKQPETTAQK